MNPAASAAPVEATDEALVAAARRGESAALVTLYRRYVAEVYGFAMNNVGNAQDAEDITGETFARVVDNLDAFRGEATFRTWLYAIARNQVRDHFRRNGRHPTVELDPSRVAEAGTDATVETGPATASAGHWTALGRTVLDRLPENYRRVLTLRILEERSVRETAAILATSEGNVKVLQHRALKRAAEVAQTLGASPDDDSV
jgi:RNA polymerase sigma-70 factor (ECF subfamily)